MDILQVVVRIFDLSTELPPSDNALMGEVPG